jgi:hypothetical protein
MLLNSDTSINFAYILPAILVAIFIGVAVWAMIEWPKKLAAQRAVEKKMSAARAVRVRTLGWQYAATPEKAIKFRLSGSVQDGAAWQLWFDLDTDSSSSSPKLTFAVADKKSPLPRFHISDAANYEAMRTGVGRKALGVATALLDRLANGKLKKMADFYDRATTRRHGNWIVASTSPMLLSTPHLQDALAELDRFPKNEAGYAPSSKAIQIWQDEQGLQVEIQGEYADMDGCEHLCKIGFLLSRDIH